MSYEFSVARKHIKFYIIVNPLSIILSTLCNIITKGQTTSLKYTITSNVQNMFNFLCFQILQLFYKSTHQL